VNLQVFGGRPSENLTRADDGVNPCTVRAARSVVCALPYP